MPRARRSAHLFLRLSDELVPELSGFLEGRIELARQPRVLALSALTGREQDVTADLERLLALPAHEWAEVADEEAHRLRRLADAGAVLLDTPEEPYAGLRALEERLTETGWHPHASLFHAFSTWEDVDVGELPVGPPPGAPARPAAPPPFRPHPQAGEPLELPLERPDDGLFRLLLERRTTRGLDPEASLSPRELGLLLLYAFGCHGYLDLGGAVVLRKTSPSGGGLHPIEAYPLVIGVDGFDPGLYHYRADLHALEPVVALDRDTARERLVEYAAGQRYLSGASVLVLLVARFDRSFWKYPHPRAYTVLHMDAAHLSQTLYLVAAELGLGAFVSAAVNSGNAERELGLDGFREGVLAVCGVGRPTREASPFDAAFEPFVPRQTRIGG